MKIDKLDIYFWAWLAMGAFIMYYVYIVYGPTLEILDNQDKQNQLIIEQNDEIIDNQNNNTRAIAALVQENRANQDEAISYLVSILNQSNVIGNQTADLILESIRDVRLLEQNITKKNDIQRAEIVLDITTALEHIGKHLDELSAQHNNIMQNQSQIKEVQNKQSGRISGFLGGPLIKNNSVPLNFGLLNRTGNTTK